MFATSEVRWFFVGEVPAAVWQHWNDTHTFAMRASGEKRTDLYLLRPGMDDVGVKLRGGGVSDGGMRDMLEIKQREGEGIVLKFGEHIEGRREQWGKWGFQGSAQKAGELLARTAEHASWVRVKKERSSRACLVKEDHGVLEVVAAQERKRGCNVEITILEIGGQTWWTLGLEAFGEKRDENVWVTAQWLFERLAHVELREQDSYGYPAWLRRLEESGKRA